ncbi:hypothetical protein [Solirubrum puertoriconensis]|uniref:Uncharacterized protein n=1 Tax=Solirubrum puertoriconensis TaxID=1751427 RepID=A0A9X0HMG0_SOLP1|nr:hypothetical protein [Solirubrum puertoriconensis]KUG08633.1 hypothetical protein ASU33_10835 [Solirubrum puertoriconensis]
MKTPFRLDDHPRRQQPLASPPDGYFDKLPLRVMQRVRPAEPEAAPLFGWLAALSAPLRTALASVLLLVAFVGTYWLTDSPARYRTPTGAVATVPAATSERALAAVPHAEVVQYLLTNDERLTLQDFSETPIADRDLTATFLPGTSRAELEAALDEQPSVDVYL